MSPGEGTYYRSTIDDVALHPALSGRHETDVCIVGGGFAGLNTALGLCERGMREVIVIEARRIGHGASGRNGGFVFSGFSRGEADLLRDLGARRAKSLHSGTVAAVDLIRDRCRRYAIDCDLVDEGVIWANWFRDPAGLRARQRLLAEHFGVEWHWIERARMRELLDTDRYAEGLFEPNAFHFHPLKYGQGIARTAMEQGVRIHEDSPATGLSREGSRWRVCTPDGEILARHVVLACGGYLAGLRREVDAAVLPIATYVMVTEPLGERLSSVLHTKAAVYDTRFAFDYYRPLLDGRLLWGGRISVRDRSPEAVKRLLLRDLAHVYPQLRDVGVDFAWPGLMSYARHKMPQIARIDEGMWVAQAFGGHGVAPTTFAGEILAAAIAEGDDRWREFADYGLLSAMKPAGFLGAQLTYWWLQLRDAFRDLNDGARGR
ncbi:MAG: FAD-binding oxidoreductase [Xanthomonadaceae bacterium]|nr:FAD-binding oxidoreductase [Xanthomonadaceae bacterium]